MNYNLPSMAPRYMMGCIWHYFIKLNFLLRRA